MNLCLFRLELSYNDKNLVFGFDRHFGSTATQRSVFEEIIPLLEHTISGMHSCGLAYGGAGAGKSYTMIGTPDAPGLMPLAVEQSSSLMAMLSGVYLSLGEPSPRRVSCQRSGWLVLQCEAQHV